MQKINELFEKGEYQEILELTKDSLEPQEIFFRASSLIELGKRREALDVVINHRDALFKSRPIATMKADFELRFALGEFDEAYDDLSYFSNLPYVSQQVEEELRELPKRIREEEKAYLLQGAGKERDLGKMLSSSDPYAVLGALSKIGKEGLKGYEARIEGILSSNAYHDVKVFALEVLVSQGYDKEVAFLDEGVKKMLNPSHLSSPFAEPNYRQIREALSKEKDSSLSQVSISLLDQIALSSFPELPFEGGDPEAMGKALLSLGREYLGGKEGQEGALEQEKTRFRAILSKHPPLP